MTDASGGPVLEDENVAQGPLQEARAQTGYIRLGGLRPEDVISPADPINVNSKLVIS